MMSQDILSHVIAGCVVTNNGSSTSYSVRVVWQWALWQSVKRVRHVCCKHVWEFVKMIKNSTNSDSMKTLQGRQSVKGMKPRKWNKDISTGTATVHLLLSPRDIFGFSHMPINISAGLCVQHECDISKGLWEIKLPPPLTTNLLTQMNGGNGDSLCWLLFLWCRYVGRKRGKI